MHEMSIASEILVQLERLSGEHQLRRVEEIAVEAGRLRGVVPEALDIAWESLTEGTLAEGSRLRLRVVPTEARCLHCQETFQPEVDSFLCPGCNRAEVELLSGNQIILTSVTGS